MSAVADKLFECVWLFCGGWRLKGKKSFFGYKFKQKRINMMYTAITGEVNMQNIKKK